MAPLPQNKSIPSLKKLEDCDRPACDETVSVLSAALNRVQRKKEKDIGGGSDGGVVLPDCPPSKNQIGSSTWTLLHSMVRDVFLKTVWLDVTNKDPVYFFKYRLHGIQIIQPKAKRKKCVILLKLYQSSTRVHIVL